MRKKAAADMVFEAQLIPDDLRETLQPETGQARHGLKFVHVVEENVLVKKGHERGRQGC
jgi:hypothetical protein